ncbi:MAG: hypothetical protein P9L99_13395 [Candidatus Lernaella stagnicola]|nr:hypothetical protein [Candidatus Lernaella stagnicola]
MNVPIEDIIRSIALLKMSAEKAASRPLRMACLLHADKLRELITSELRPDLTAHAISQRQAALVSQIKQEEYHAPQ